MTLTSRIREIAYTRIRRVTTGAFILSLAPDVNHKRVHRLYCLAGLNLRHTKPRRHKNSSLWISRSPVGHVNQCWHMDFVCDELLNGIRLRFLAVVDSFSREYLAIEADQCLTGEDVAHIVEQITLTRGKSEQIFLDNGGELISKTLDKWAYEQHVALAFLRRLGKPTDNAYIESFNGSFRDECLNMLWFLSLDDAQQKAEN